MRANSSGLKLPSWLRQPKIAGADLPDDVAAHLAMIGADAPSPGVVREAALFGAGIQGNAPALG